MQTVLSKTGIEVSYPCTVHLLCNGENLECEYKSDHTGRDLLEYTCKVQKITEASFWGMKFTDLTGLDEQRHWLDLNKLIRPQVKAISPIRFYFRTKVYPPEPYKITDQPLRHLIFQQLRLDLLGGRLFCTVVDAAMMVALILQHIHGNFSPRLLWMYNGFMKSKILRQERCTREFFQQTQNRALDIYQNLLGHLSQLEVEDMFLRLASKLESYGVEPFLVRDINKTELLLWMNYLGFRAISKKRKTIHLPWSKISKITHEGKGLFVHLVQGGVIVLECINFSECNYIWSICVDHLVYFTAPTYVSTSVTADVKYLSNETEECLSELSSYFSSCITEYKLFKTDVLEDNLEGSCSLLRLIDFNSWKSQLSVIYTVLILYLMGSHTAIFEDLPFFLHIRTTLKNFLSKFVFNKMLTY